MSASAILNAVRSGRMTAERGAMLLELRRELAWRRQPLWFRIVMGLLR